MNYFSPKSAAERYAMARPYFHAGTIRRIAHFTDMEQGIGNALDIACGTGLSSKALLEIASEVYATDISDEMLRLAADRDRIRYFNAPAESLPFQDAFFDLLTVSSGVHWFDIPRFLTEACRVLRPGSWLVLYDNYFLSEMEGVEEFRDWFPEVYLRKYPSPPRNGDYDWSDENIRRFGFRIMGEENFKNTVEFTMETLIRYFTTQSNITAAVESGMTDYEEVENWLDRQIGPFFGGSGTRTVLYGNRIQYLRKTGTAIRP